MIKIAGELAKLARDEGFALGIAVACGIALADFGEEVAVNEILIATGFTTRRKMKSLGVEDYDLNRLKPAFAWIKENKKP